MKQIFILLVIIILLEYNNANQEEWCNLRNPQNENDCTNEEIFKNDQGFRCCYEKFRLIKINDKQTCRWINKDEYKEEIKRLKKYGAKAVKVDCKSGFYFLNNLLLIIIIFLFF